MHKDKEKGFLVLLRHGESLWNRQNLFTGWVDVPLSRKGIGEALEVGKRLSVIPFGTLFVSDLVRAQMTAMLVMSEHVGGMVPIFQRDVSQKSFESWCQNFGDPEGTRTIPVIVAWELNERMYGELQGRNKEEVRNRFGAEQVKKWRRSYEIAPPGGESLKMTSGRVLPYFRQHILAHLREGQHVLVVAHGNSLRAMMMELESLSREEVVNLEIATGEPVCYSYAESHFTRVGMEEMCARFSP